LPWRNEESLTSGQQILRPTVDVRLSAGGLATTTKALIDTGAPVTVFPRGIGDLLGFTFPDLASQCEERLTILGNKWAAIRETVSLTVADTGGAVAWDASVLFVMEDRLPFALLGYEGFLNSWSVTFNGAFNYLIIEPADEGDERFRPIKDT